jgi:hypothetical protein
MFYFLPLINCADDNNHSIRSCLSSSSLIALIVMKFFIIFLTFLVLMRNVEMKGRGGGGGGGFKLFNFKKSSSRSAKAKSKSVSRVAPAESNANGKYFSRDVPLSQKDYGATFKHGLSQNSYIYNNYYRTHSKIPGIAQFITNALFFRAGMKIGRKIGDASQYDEWNAEDDKRWRMTTKSPYFENKIPGIVKF